MARCDLPAPRLAGGTTLNTARVILGNRHQVLRLRVHSWKNVGKTSTVKTCRLAFDVGRGAVTVLDRYVCIDTDKCASLILRW